MIAVKERTVELRLLIRQCPVDWIEPWVGANGIPNVKMTDIETGDEYSFEVTRELRQIAREERKELTI